MSRSSKQRLLFFSYHYPPDQSAGSVRSRDLVEAIAQEDTSVDVFVFCSQPRRYGMQSLPNDVIKPKQLNIHVKRFWSPYFGQGPVATLLSYLFYFFQALPAAICLRPSVIVGTSAKLLTSFVAACAALVMRARLFVDLRDTFADNYFYFYRWNKRIIFQSLIMATENIVLRSAYSVNIVSAGFQTAFAGWERLLAKHSISLTNYPNGIDYQHRMQISASSSRGHLSESGMYRIAYFGNLGQGQDLITLFKKLYDRPDLLDEMKRSSIQIDIYGSGPQASQLKSLLSKPHNCEQQLLISDLVHYHGFLPRGELYKVYSTCDCLMLQLGSFSSLSMVMPTKILEYSATPYPIIYGASGYTKDLIGQISGAVPFRQSDPASFLAAAQGSRTVNVDTQSRARFLDRFDSSTIYSDYARHILNS